MLIRTRLTILAAIATLAAWHAIDRDINARCHGNARCIAASR